MRPLEPDRAPATFKGGPADSTGMEGEGFARASAGEQLPPRAVGLLALAGLGIAGLWAFLADRMFEGNARSLLAVDALAVALAALCAGFAAKTWKGRGLAFLLVLVVGLSALAVAYLVYNALNPPME